MNDWVVGVDLGRTKIALGLIDPQNRIVARSRLATQSEAGPDAVVERIAQSVAELSAHLPNDAEIAALGICSPGPVDHAAGLVLEPHEMDGLHNTPLRDLLAKRLGVPVSIDHDAKSAALGEYHYGAGQGTRAMVYIVIGTGVGAAIVVDGQVFRGVHNLAGEVGHITINRDGALCACGSRGCVETYMSGPWLARHYAHRRLRADSARASDSVASGELITHMAEQGEPIAIQVLEEAGSALGVAIASMAMIMDIDRYVIGGSVAKAGELLLAPARRSMVDYSFRSISSQIQVVASTMRDDAPILGCGWQARDALHRGQ
jgi:glucokinase